MPKTAIMAELKQKKLPIPPEFDDYLDISRAVIMEIDMHGGHLDTGPDCPAPSMRGRDVIEPINAFNRRCRELGVPVVHVVNTYRKGDFEGVESAWRRLTEGHRSMLPREVIGPDSPYGNLGLENTKWSQLSVEMGEQDYVVDTKKRISAFEATDMDFLMKQLGKDVLVITGIMSDCCDLCSAFIAAGKDYKLLYAWDLTRGSSPQNEQAAKDIIGGYLGLVVDSEELLEEWQEQGSEF